MKVLPPAASRPASPLAPSLSPLSVVALSFGLAVGWGAFVLPGTKFLPDAGPLGTLLGIVLGAVGMGVFALNYHRLNLRESGPGGAFSFARRVFGDDHAFIVGWFLFLTYVAILWANATALVLLVRDTLGPVLQFGFHYTLAGFDIYCGEALLGVAAIALAAALYIFGRRLSARVQTVLALVFVLGVAVFTAFAAVFTGLVGTLIATSRLMYAMADDGILPARLGALDAAGVPRNAILFVAAISFLVPFFGRSVISWPVDVSIIGAAIAYCYTSAAAYKASGSIGAGKILTARLAGLVGVVLSILFCVLLLVYLSGGSMASESYLLLAVWCLCGFLFYRAVYRKDRAARFGKSSVAWVVLIVLIIFSSLMWGRQAMCETSTQVFARVAAEHGEDVRHYARHLEHVRNLSLVNSLVELLLLVVSLVIMLSLYTLLRRRECDMAVVQSKAEETNRAKNHFFSSVSHDIRTPLNAIIGFSQMLKGGFRTAAETNEAIDSILVSSKMLLCLINDVLDFSKLESGRMEILPKPTDAPALVAEIVKSFKIARRTPGVEIRSVIGEMPPLYLDPQRIRQIVFNLVGNAAKFTTAGHIEVRASFTRNEGKETGLFRLEVEDTGPGISAEDQQKIAQPYAQFGSSRSRSKGTGLGLAICRQLAQAMGGELALRSELGRGSTFMIILPEAAIAPAPPPTAAMPAEPAPGEKASGGVRRILTVDDQPMNLMVLKAMLMRLGSFEIVSAKDGREALDILTGPNEAPFDLVLSDMWMPRLDGEGFVRALRADARFASLPVYVLTADIEAQKTCTEIGFTGILLKPVTIDGLKSILAAVRAAKQ